MEKLNEMELAYLQKGIEQERKGVRVHALMPHETEDLYNSYIWQLRNAAQEIDVLTVLRFPHKIPLDKKQCFELQ